MPSHFIFIDALPQDAPKRQRELQLAEARQHAAKISHSRRQGITPRMRSLAKHNHSHNQTLSLGKLAAVEPVKCDPSRLPKDGDALVAYFDTIQALEKYLQLEESQDKSSEEVKMVSELLQVLWNRDLSKLVASSYQMDPFYRIPHGNSISFYEAIDFFTHTVLPNNIPVYSIFNVSNIFTTYTFDLASKGHFLHTWTATMHLIRSLFTPQSRSAQTALRHQGAALAQLQRAVSQSRAAVDDYTICSVLMVALLARLYGNQQSHAMHCHYLQRMIEQRGGLDNLAFDGITRCAILQWESFWALDTGTSIFQGLRQSEPPIYPSVPLSRELRIQIWKLPVGFQRLAHQGRLAIDVLELLGRIATYAPWKPVFSANTAQWSRRKYDDFWEACRCLADPAPGLEKFLCLALLLYCVDEYSPQRQFRRGMTTFGGPRALLTRELPKFVSCREDAEMECLLWIWIVVVDAWSSDCTIEEELPLTGQQCLHDLRRAFPDITSWKDVRCVLRRFFWSKRFAGVCEAFWCSYGFVKDL